MSSWEFVWNCSRTCEFAKVHILWASTSLMELDNVKSKHFWVSNLRTRTRTRHYDPAIWACSKHLCMCELWTPSFGNFPMPFEFSFDWVVFPPPFSTIVNPISLAISCPWIHKSRYLQSSWLSNLDLIERERIKPSSSLLWPWWCWWGDWEILH